MPSSIASFSCRSLTSSRSACSCCSSKTDMTLPESSSDSNSPMLLIDIPASRKNKWSSFASDPVRNKAAYHPPTARWERECSSNRNTALSEQIRHKALQFLLLCILTQLSPPYVAYFTTLRSVTSKNLRKGIFLNINFLFIFGSITDFKPPIGWAIGGS